MYFIKYNSLAMVAPGYLENLFINNPYLVSVRKQIGVIYKFLQGYYTLRYTCSLVPYYNNRY